MQHTRLLTVLSLAALMLISAIVPAAAQDTSSLYPVNTITVTGTGTAAGAPDVAYLQLGVDTSDADLKAAFTTTNDKIDAVIAALIEAGIDRADIRTVGFNIYQDRQPVGDGTEFNVRYSVSNLLRVTARDIAHVADIINVGIDAGANALYGLEFSINDRAALESEARAAAMDDARTRAAELAKLAGVELGDIVIISETTLGSNPMFDTAKGLGGGGGAAIEPGQLSVNISLNVTFRIAR